MTFNWFNRKLNEQPETATTPEPSETQPGSPEEQPKEAAAEEYLNFAKIAYENLKKKQQAAQAETPQEAQEAPAETPAPSAGSETEEPEPALAAPEATAVPEPVAEAPSEISSPEPVVEAPSAIEAPQTEPAAEATSTEAEEPAVAQPFWLRAEADREARLERLRELAIEEPEPEPIAASKPQGFTLSEEELAALQLDEGFLWSAEVLAAQGRRAEDVSLEEITWLKRLRQGLDKTRRTLINQLKAIVGQGPLNEDAVMEIESLLLQADVGVAATDAIIQGLQSKLREEALPPEQAIAYLKQLLRDMLDRPIREGSHRRSIAPEKDQLNIWLMTGVNGAGKTTTIGKLAHIATKSGYKCLIAAADTFRAAAVEQVKVWGSRSEVEVIANPGQNTDPAAVVFDAISAAQVRGTELLLVDTAGRLQNKKNLMDELAKIRRIVDKKAENANVEALLVLDATLGQNGLLQAKVFAEAAQLSGVVLTKLDGTAKGGVALAVVQQLGLPIRFIGAGEGIEDLRPFSSYEFVEALISG